MKALALFLPLALSLVLPAAPAVALSCAPYDEVLAYRDAASSADRYVVAHGVLDFNPGDQPVADPGNPDLTPQGTTFTASLTGFSLTENGFVARFVQNVQVSVECVGPWCGTLKPGGSYLVFLKRSQAGYLLEAAPCGGFALADPSDDALERVVACFRGGRCVSEFD